MPKGISINSQYGTPPVQYTWDTQEHHYKKSVQYTTGTVHTVQDAQGKQAKYFTALNCNLYKANNFKWSSQTKFK